MIQIQVGNFLTNFCCLVELNIPLPFFFFLSKNIDFLQHLHFPKITCISFLIVLYYVLMLVPQRFNIFLFLMLFFHRSLTLKILNSHNFIENQVHLPEYIDLSVSHFSLICCYPGYYRENFSMLFYFFPDFIPQRPIYCFA